MIKLTRYELAAWNLRMFYLGQTTSSEYWNLNELIISPDPENRVVAELAMDELNRTRDRIYNREEENNIWEHGH